MFSVGVPVPPWMKLDHFQPDGIAYFVVDPITPGPTITSKSHPERAKKKKGGELTEPISKKK